MHMSEKTEHVITLGIAIAFVLLIGLLQVWFFDWDWRCLLVRCAIAH